MDQLSRRGLAHKGSGDIDGGQGGLHDPALRDIIKTGDGDIVGNPVSP